MFWVHRASILQNHAELRFWDPVLLVWQNTLALCWLSLLERDTEISCVNCKSLNLVNICSSFSV